MSVHRNRALAANPKRNDHVNRIRTKEEKGRGKRCRKALFHGWGAS